MATKKPDELISRDHIDYLRRDLKHQRSEVPRLRDETVKMTGKVAPSPVREYSDRPRIIQNSTDERPRVTTNLDRETMEALEKLAASTNTNKAKIVRDAITAMLQSSDRPTPIKTRKGKIVVRSVPQAIFLSKLVIATIDEALEYDPTRHHNQPPPALWIEEPDYLSGIKQLVGELRRLNLNLEAIKTLKSLNPALPENEVEKSAIDVKKHVNKFLDKYASALGTGTGVLTVGLLATLLYQLGVPETVFEHILKKIH